MEPTQDAFDATPTLPPGEPSQLPDDGYALGWECANPALQIEAWVDAAAQPLHPAC